MPPKRHTSGVAQKSQQSTLAFHGAANKITKAGTRTTNAKKNIIAEPAVKDVKPALDEPDAVGVPKPTSDKSDATEESKPIIDEPDAAEEPKPTTVEAGIIEQAKQEVAVQHVAPTPEEEAARRITDARIKKYWNDNGGKSDKLRAHQKDITVHEKILREFDMSGQYGVSALDEVYKTCLEGCADMATACIALYRHRPTETLEASPPPRPKSSHRSSGCIVEKARWR